MKLLFLILMIVGLMLFVWLVFQLVTGLRSLNWPSVVGELIMKDADATASALAPRRYVYRYNVRGIDYFAQRLTVSDVFISRSRMISKVLKMHPDGAMITVYYHKQRPQSALLERGPRRETFIFLGLSLLFFAGALYGYLSFDH